MNRLLANFESITSSTEAVAELKTIDMRGKGRIIHIFPY